MHCFEYVVVSILILVFIMVGGGKETIHLAMKILHIRNIPNKNIAN